MNKKSFLKRTREEKRRGTYPPNFLKFFPKSLKKDRDFVLELVKINGHLFEFFQDFNNDWGIVKNAIKSEPSNFKYASGKWKHDKNMILYLISLSSSYGVMELIPKVMRNKKDIAMAIYNKMHTLYFMPEPFIDKKLALEAVTYDCSEYNFIPEKYKDDKDILNIVLNNDVRYMFEDLPDKIQHNKKIILEMLKKSYHIIHCIPKDMKDDDEIMLAIAKAYKKDRDSIMYTGDAEYIKQRMNENDVFAKKMIEVDGTTIKYASEKIRSDKDMVMLGLKTSSETLEYASEKIRNNKSFISKALTELDYCSFLRYTSKDVRKDEKIIKKAFKKFGNRCSNWILAEALGPIKGDKDFVSKIIKLSPESFRFASLKLRKDKEIVYEAVQKDGSMLRFTTSELQHDKMLYNAALSNIIDRLEEKNISKNLGCYFDSNIFEWTYKELYEEINFHNVDKIKLTRDFYEILAIYDSSFSKSDIEPSILKKLEKIYNGCIIPEINQRINYILK